MKHIAKIRLLKERTLSDYDTRDLDLATGDQVMVEWEDGLKMGTIVKLTEIDSELTSPKRKVTDADIDYESRKEHKEKEAHRACTAKIKEMGLPMNLVRVEHMPSINKYICYFSAEGRVDFRNLVKTLASDFHARVEMKQIGARNRAKMVGGLGRCGRELCCSLFLQDFDPITVRMAKDQGLSLDPTKISGVCGRLMCCLNYEREYYERIKKNLPKIGKKILTKQGEGKVIRQNILKETLIVALESGEEFEVDARDFVREGLFKKKPIRSNH